MATARFHDRVCSGGSATTTVEPFDAGEPADGRRPGRRRRTSGRSASGLPVGRRRVDRHRGIVDDRHEIGGHGVITIGASGGFVCRGPNVGGRRHRPGPTAGSPDHAGRGTVRAARAYGRRRRAARRPGSRRPGWGGGSRRRPRRRRRRTPGRAPRRPSTVRCPDQGQRGGQLVGGQARPSRHSRSAMRADLGQGPGPLGLDAERVEPPGRAPGQAFGAGRQQQPEVGPGRRLAELVAQPGPLALGLAGGDPLARGSSAAGRRRGRRWRRCARRHSGGRRR